MSIFDFFESGEIKLFLCPSAAAPPSQFLTTPDIHTTKPCCSPSSNMVFLSGYMLLCAFFRAVTIMLTRVFAHFHITYSSSTSVQTVLKRHFPDVALVDSIATPYF